MYFITSFYKFFPFKKSDLTSIKESLDSTFSSSLVGLILLSPEGINATVSGDELSFLSNFKDFFSQYFSFDDVILKDSNSQKKPFKRFKVDVRDEIITYDGKTQLPAPSAKSFLSPKEWHEILAHEKDFILIDTRNDYETTCGVFEGAIDPKIKTFTEFKKYYQEHQFPKDKKILMYCTGGVRCEKAVSDLESQGYDNVYQLHGGILKYMEEYPTGHFKGECFVFDHRVSVDSNMSPSDIFSLCPHCGDPGKEHINCRKCKQASVVCKNCLTKDANLESCSKNCAYWLETH